MSISAKYGYTPNQDAIARSLEVIAAGLEEVASEQLYKDCFGIMDQTTLANEDTPERVKKLVEKVNRRRVGSFCRNSFLESQA